MIKNILFDLGGVLYHIAYIKTIKAFENLGIENAKEVYSQQKQSEFFDLFETGKITEEQFFYHLNLLSPKVKKEDLKAAWNTMLLGMPRENKNLLATLKSKYNLYLLHEIGMRKPHLKTFEWVLKDAGIKPNETLFIEDSIQHIEGAKLAGLHCCHISSNEPITQAFLDKALQVCR